MALGRLQIDGGNFFANSSFNLNFNSVQRVLVLEDYAPPALRVQGFVSRKKGARSMGEEKKEGGKIIIIIGSLLNL